MTFDEHREAMRKIGMSYDDRVEGDCYYENKSKWRRHPALDSKRTNLFTLGKKSKHILEIGFNAGTSALVFLTASPDSKLHCFDLAVHPYTVPLYEYLRAEFPGRIQLTVGDSRETLRDFHEPDIDLFHIDGGHDYEVFTKDFKNCRRLAASGATFIWDDMQYPPIADYYWRTIIGLGYGLDRTSDYLKTDVYSHAIGVFT